MQSNVGLYKEKNQLSNDNRPSPNALTAVQGKFTYSPFENTNVKPESDVLREEFRPFVFNGLVSVDNEVHPIRNLKGHRYFSVFVT